MDSELSRSEVCFSQLFSRVKLDDQMSRFGFLTREDSRLLRMFLHKEDFDVEKALDSLRNYLDVRVQCQKVFIHYKMDSLIKGIVTKTVLILPQMSKAGTVLVFKVGAWNPNDCSIYEISALLTLLMESVGLDDLRRSCGYSVIYDLKGVFLKQMHAMRPAVKVLKTISQSYLSSQCKYQLIANAMMPAMVTAMMNLVSFSKDIKNVPYPRSGDNQKTDLEDIFGADFVPNLPVEYGGSETYDWYESTQQMVQENLTEFA